MYGFVQRLRVTVEKMGTVFYLWLLGVVGFYGACGSYGSRGFRAFVLSLRGGGSSVNSSAREPWATRRQQVKALCLGFKVFGLGFRVWEVLLLLKLSCVSCADSAGLLDQPGPIFALSSERSERHHGDMLTAELVSQH